MTSIHTNSAATVALSTLRRISADLSGEQSRVSSGLRVQTAADAAAYWSIATTMRSDNKALAAVSDALGLGAAIVDTAYSGLDTTIGILGQFKAKLVAAREEGVDKAKIQTELDQMKEEVKSIAQSANFGGQNWLNTDISNIYDDDLNKRSIVSSFVRGESGDVSVKTLDYHLSEVSLFNSSQGGLLQKDARDIGTIGGIRYLQDFWDGTRAWTEWVPERRSGSRAVETFTFSGPLTFDDPGDQISFDVTVDADNPADGIPGPYNPGRTTPVTIDRTTIDAVNSGWNGIISNYKQYAAVLSYALSQTNTGAYTTTYTDSYGNPIVNRIGIGSLQDRSAGLDGSYVEVSNFMSTVGSGGLGNLSGYGSRGSTMTFSFDPFIVYKDGDNPDGVEVSLNFYVNGSPAKSYSFDRSYVNDLLGKDTGKVDTAGEMVTLLQSLLGTDWPDVVITADTPSTITIKSDEMVDRLSGSDTRIGFGGIDVSIEPLPTLNFEDIDVEKHPTMIDNYITYLETVTQRITDGAAGLGALRSRISMQTEFTRTLSATLDKSIGRLVDNDMDVSSARIKALETQEQLGLQALSIANGEPEGILRLFQ